MPEEEQATSTEETTEEMQTTDTPESTDETSSEETQDEGTMLGKKATDDGAEEGKEGKADVESYDFKLPEGMAMDENLRDAVVPLFKEAGINQDTAQKIVDEYAKYVTTKGSDLQKELSDNWGKQLNEWKEETKKDYGTGLKETLSFASRAIDKFGSDRLREALDDTGLGNHPEFVRFFSRVGKAISEDSFVDPEQKASSSQGINLKKLYPSMKE